MLRENSCQPVQGSGIIGQMDAQAHQPSVFYQAALHDSREQAHIDISTADQHCDFFAAERRLAIDEGGNRRRTGALGERLFALQQKKNCIGDFFFVHGHDVIDVFLDQRQRLFPRAPHRDAIGDCRRRA